MDDKFVNSIKNLDYADMKESQEKKLREVERQFNEEFGTEYYLMAMTKDHE